MTWNSELMTWAIPGVTWTLALVAYVALLVVEKQLKLKRSFDWIRRRVGELGQARHPGLGGMGHLRVQQDHAAEQDGVLT